MGCSLHILFTCVPRLPSLVVAMLNDGQVGDDEVFILSVVLITGPPFKEI